MTIRIQPEAYETLVAHLESAYPEEGAGFLLGNSRDDLREISRVVLVANTREDAARYNRFEIDPMDMVRAEDEADELGLEVLGVFHSHPDCPNIPSEFDRQWALPWYSYAITRVDAGRAVSTRSWRLTEDRERYFEENFEIAEREPVPGTKN